MSGTLATARRGEAGAVLSSGRREAKLRRESSGCSRYRYGGCCSPAWCDLALEPTEYARLMPDSAEAADGALFVADSGEADLPVVLCLHSLFMDGRMFDAFVQEAAGRYRV